MSHYVLYIPGILDDIAKVQSSLFRTWRRYGLKSRTHVIPWLGEADYDRRAEVLLNRIDRLAAAGHTVSLIGASAGASAVLNAFHERPDTIAAVVLICPKVNNSNNIGTKIVEKNPSFKESMDRLDRQLPLLTKAQKSKILTFLSPRDGLIPYIDSTIDGVPEMPLPALRHNAAIVYALSFGSARIARQLKRIAAAA